MEGADAINAASIASDQVLHALHLAQIANGGLEHLQFGAAETLALLGRDTDRTVTLDQQPALAVGLDTGHVAGDFTDLRQGPDPFFQGW